MSRTSGKPFEWSYAEYARLPDDGNRYEVIDGEVCVTPAPGPPHQKIAGRLFLQMQPYIESNALGELFWDIDLLFQSGQYLRPDLTFVPAAALDGVTDRGVEVRPGLVIEVLSPHSDRIDRKLKPVRYRDFGVPEYWIVDRFSRTVEVYRLAADADADMRSDFLNWQPDPSAPALRLDVGALFAGS